MSDDRGLLRYKKALSELQDRIRGKAVREGFYVQWHLTDRCNLRCKHCYYSDAPIKDLPPEQLKGIFDKYLKSILKWKLKGTICLIGGEPILRDDFFELLDYIYTRWKEHPIFSAPFMSNGVRIDEEFISRLEPYSAIVPQIQVSLDGTCEETHGFIRGKGSFEKAKKGLRLLHENGFGTALHFVVSKTNYKDAFDVMKLGDELKVTRVTVSRLVPEGRGCTLEMITSPELKELWTYLSERCIDSYPKGVFLARGRCDLWHLADIPSTLYSLK